MKIKWQSCPYQWDACRLPEPPWVMWKVMNLSYEWGRYILLLFKKTMVSVALISSLEPGEAVLSTAQHWAIQWRKNSPKWVWVKTYHTTLGMINIHLPSGEHTKSYGKSQCLMGKSTISMAIFHCYLSSPEGNHPFTSYFGVHQAFNSCSSIFFPSGFGATFRPPRALG